MRPSKQNEKQRPEALISTHCPTVEALLRDPQTAANPLALPQFDFGLLQQADDLLGRKLSTAHS
jgi:hypothetical protein